MKVRVSFTIDIDPKAWSEEYGVETAAEIRQDVSDNIRYGVLAHLEEQGLLKA